jgi:hypothetical protein
MDPDPHPHLRTLRPLLGGQGTLALDRRGDRVGGASEGDEERVALRVDHLAPVRGEDLAEQPLLVGEQLAVPGPAEQLE